MPLSSKAIKNLVGFGLIIIDPYEPENVKGASIDVCLGEYYYRLQKTSGSRIRNLYSPNCARELWGQVQRAKTLQEHDIVLDNVRPDEQIILLGPKEMIMAHTAEFVGSKNGFVAEIKGRSSFRRNAFTVCGDGNWGDPGYIGRWTMVLENHSHDTVPLVVNRRIAQIIFDEVYEGENYHTEGVGGKYQRAKSLEEIKASWTPDIFLPQMHHDRECKK